MRMKKLGIVAAALTIFIAVAIGNASASTWSGTDYSQFQSGNSLIWSSTVSDTEPTVSAGTQLTWANTFDNECIGSTAYGILFASDELGGWTTTPAPQIAAGSSHA